MNRDFKKINKTIKILISFVVIIFLLVSSFTLPAISVQNQFLSENEVSEATDFNSESTIEVLYPEDKAYDVEIEGMNTTLKVNIAHPDWEEMNVKFIELVTGENHTIGYHNHTEEKAHIYWEDLEYGTTYTWFVKITDANDVNGEWENSNPWIFTTEHIPNKVREPIRPEDDATEIPADTRLEVVVNHPEGEDMWVIFFGGEKDEEKSYLGERPVSDKGTASIFWEDLNYDTTYEWYVIVEEDKGDPNTTMSVIWSFTTKNFEVPRTPEYPEDGDIGLSIGPDKQTELRVEVNHPENKDMNVTFLNSIGDEVYKIGSDTGVSSGEEAMVTWEDLEYGTNYNWFVEIKDDAESNRESDEWEFETEHIPNKVRNPIYPPHNEQKLDIGSEMETELRVEVNHPEDKEMNVTFWNSTGSEASAIGVDSGVSSGEEASVIWDHLKSNTSYEWYVEVEDGDFSTKSEVWQFATIRSLELNIEIEGEGIVEIVWNEEEYEVEDGGNYNIREGTNVHLTTHPLEGWYFEGWSGDIICTTPSIEINISEDKVITAKFEIYEYNLEILIEGEGTVDVDPEYEKYEYGTEVTLSIIPAEGWYFDEWTGDYESDEEEIIIIMDNDKDITAHLSESLELEINVDGNGIVEVQVEGEILEEVENEWSENFNAGTEIRLTAIPDESWGFNEWTGDYESEEKEITITMDSDKNLIPHFAELFELRVSIEVEDRLNGDEVGMVEVEIDGEVVEEVEDEWSEEFMEGTEVKLTATTEDYGMFKEWTGDYEGEEDEINIMVDEDKEIIANFFISVRSSIQKTIPGFTSSLLFLAVFFAVIIYFRKTKDR